MLNTHRRKPRMSRSGELLHQNMLVHASNCRFSADKPCASVCRSRPSSRWAWPISCDLPHILTRWANGSSSAPGGRAISARGGKLVSSISPTRQLLLIVVLCAGVISAAAIALGASANPPDLLADPEHCAAVASNADLPGDLFASRIALWNTGGQEIDASRREQAALVETPP